jgi:hypothetical protein
MIIIRFIITAFAVQLIREQMINVDYRAVVSTKIGEKLKASFARTDIHIV